MKSLQASALRLAPRSSHPFLGTKMSTAVEDFALTECRGLGEPRGSGVRGWAFGFALGSREASENF